MKKIIQETLNDYVDLEGSIDVVINRLNELKSKYPHYELGIDIHQEYECFEPRLIGKRLETDKEEQDRLLEEAQLAEQKRIKAEKRMANQMARMEKLKEQERELYNKLKAKYEEETNINSSRAIRTR